MSETHLSTTSFQSLNLSEPLLRGLSEAGFTLCTHIQAQTLPISLQERDVAGQAQTGTGKTIAFLLALFEHLLRRGTQREGKSILALVLAPTRELAIQIHKDAEVIGKHTGVRVGLAYGGTDYEKQRKVLEDGVDVLIGTPGRVIDYFKQGVFTMGQVEVMVLDEADRMFDLGFIKDIRFLLRRLPKPEYRLNMLFSATLSFKVTELAYEHMNDPELVRIEPEQITAKQVEESVYYPGDREKIPLLIGLINKLQPSRSMVFINTKRNAESVQAYLEANDFDSAVLSGDVPQKKRQSILNRFQKGELPILIATDVAARGIHVPAVSHVFNFDLPQDVEDYVHRIGRTARSGASGVAISFACETFAYSLPEIEQYIGHKIPFQPIGEELLPDIQPAKRKPRKRPPGKPKAKAASGDNRQRRQRKPNRAKATTATAD